MTATKDGSRLVEKGLWRLFRLIRLSRFRNELMVDLFESLAVPGRRLMSWEAGLAYNIICNVFIFLPKFFV